MSDITNYNVKRHVLETARQYDIEVIATEIGTGRNHQILSALDDLGLQVKTVNAVLYGFELGLRDVATDVFAPDENTDIVIVDELSAMDGGSRTRTIDAILTHSQKVPFILSEAITGSHGPSDILRNLRPLFEYPAGPTIHSNI